MLQPPALWLDRSWFTFNWVVRPLLDTPGDRQLAIPELSCASLRKGIRETPSPDPSGPDWQRRRSKDRG